MSEEVKALEIEYRINTIFLSLTLHKMLCPLFYTFRILYRENYLTNLKRNFMYVSLKERTNGSTKTNFYKMVR